MNKNYIASGAVAGLIFAGGIAGTVSAQAAATATGLTEAQVLEIALLEVPGTVTEVALERHRGQQVYEVEIVSVDGVEMEVEIAASSGDVLSVAEDGEGCDKDEDAA